MYLIDSEIPIGLKHKNDFWGYYGAFILGKDNPIHNLNIVNEIKNVWITNNSITDVLPKIIKINLDDNYFFPLNLISSIFGFYHLSTSKDYGIINSILLIILVYLNYTIIKRPIKNYISIVNSRTNFSFYLNINLLFFSIFFIYLVLNNLLWSSIKLYFILSPIIFIFLCIDHSKNPLKLNKKFIVILLAILPIYKYSTFNSGIGRLDSFPSIIKKRYKI